MLKEAEAYVHERHPVLAEAYAPLPDELTFLHAEDILEAYPDLPRKQRETAILQECAGDLHLRDRLAARRRLPA